MPFPLFAHQAPAIPLKMARPAWFDGTALCVGSMAPDLGYSITSYVHLGTHEGGGILAISIPVAIVLTLVARFASSTTVANLPDFGPFRLWSWRALGTRWPAWWLTFSSAVVGVGTHLLLDGFTHGRSWGPRIFGYRDVHIAFHGHHLTVAETLQYAGDVVGAVISVLLLLHIGRRRLVEQWYGAKVVADARRFSVSRRDRLIF
ncbi:MAG TPA: DUF4184 family protein, partial [Ilumatobacteraceae bacterium]